MKKRVEIICRGIVQGIGFRPFVYQTANSFELTGFVRNQGDAGVLIVAEGFKYLLVDFVKALDSKKPHLAKYEDFIVEWKEFKGEFSTFDIIRSSNKKIGGVSYIPPDISICSECLLDMGSRDDSRYKYPFTSCAICGPRYTTITKLPYDRPNTTMTDFPLCSECSVEYNDPFDRRHHAQTTCCPKCGPKMELFDNEGNKIHTNNLYQELVKLLLEGSIIAIKGIGGTHLACSPMQDKTILRLRTRKGKRKNKPFALISSSLEEITSFAVINSKEKELLQSYRRPIVLLEKKRPFPLSEWVSPNLFNVGVMLPYSGIHSLLLKKYPEPALILTSANPSSVPMYTENHQILSKANDLADYFLLHNRVIFQRADDSVIRLTNSQPALIRRSRGWVPEPIRLPFDVADKAALGVGARLSSTAAVIKSNRCFPTQYIGDVSTLETLDFLGSSIEHLRRLLGIDQFESITHDLHPLYLSSRLAQKYSEAKSIYKIQHHFAHAISLMADNYLPLEEEIVAIVADGVGYGSDGKIWGGEVLHSRYDSFTRVAHLEEQLMIGGDRATYFPIRMAIAALSNSLSRSELESFFYSNYSESVPGGIQEIQVILEQLSKMINISYTSSTGRILAAGSALLKACSERTYEGEPAIVLESLAKLGRPGRVVFDLSNIDDGVIPTTPLLRQVVDSIEKGHKPGDIAFALQQALAEQFSKAAIEFAKKQSLSKIGFSGGVAYNDHISRVISKRVEAAGMAFLQHKNLPCGDGGISTGQAVFSAISSLQLV